jgi:hypothetical protein
MIAAHSSEEDNLIFPGQQREALDATAFVVFKWL